jgi:phosphotransferase system HPr (HPr) family protein
MNGEPLRRTITISNPQGLHMRPITAFVEMAGKFQSDVFLSKGDGQRINGKSAISLLGLAAEMGTDLVLECCGPDQEDALNALATFLTNLKNEEESGLPEVH